MTGRCCSAAFLGIESARACDDCARRRWGRLAPRAKPEQDWPAGAPGLVSGSASLPSPGPGLSKALRTSSGLPRLDFPWQQTPASAKRRRTLRRSWAPRRMWSDSRRALRARLHRGESQCARPAHWECQAGTSCQAPGGGDVHAGLCMRSAAAQERCRGTGNQGGRKRTSVHHDDYPLYHGRRPQQVTAAAEALPFGLHQSRMPAGLARRRTPAAAFR
jgi:hypothetical protein